MKLACLYNLNDKISPDGKHLPIIRGLAYEIATKQVVPAHFCERVPDSNVRSLRWLSKPPLINVI